MRITNRDELHPGGRPVQDRSPSLLVLTPRRPPRRTPRAPQCHNADDTPAGALDRRGWNDVGLRVASQCNPPTGEVATTPAG
jgi:hypothetical protein